jgi:transposase-like protein
MPPRRHDGRRRLPSNAVFRAIQAAGGPSAVCRGLGVSLPTLARWRRVGRVSDPQAVLRWAALIHAEPARQLALARQLAGLDRRGSR